MTLMWNEPHVMLFGQPEFQQAPHRRSFAEGPLRIRRGPYRRARERFGLSGGRSPRRTKGAATLMCHAAGSSYYILLTAYYLLLAPYYLLLTTYYLLLTTYYLLLTTYYLLLTTYYSLLTTYCLLLATCYLLPATCYLLRATYYLLLTTPAHGCEGENQESRQNSHWLLGPALNPETV